jgi:hypothetical protein
MRGVVVSEVLFQFSKKKIERKLGERFKKMDFETFKELAREAGLNFSKRKKLEPEFELMPFDIIPDEGHAVAVFFIRSRHIKGEWCQQINFFSALKKYLKLNEDVQTDENGWSIKVVLEGDYFPIQVKPLENGWREYKAIKELGNQ